jgi:hypothetical protein
MVAFAIEQNRFNSIKPFKVIGGTKLSGEYAIKLMKNKDLRPSKGSQATLIQNPKERLLQFR